VPPLDRLAQILSPGVAAEAEPRIDVEPRTTLIAIATLNLTDLIGPSPLLDWTLGIRTLATAMTGGQETCEARPAPSAK
jgi:hypothetical protein